MPPKKRKKDGPQAIHVRVPRDLYELIVQRAHAEERSINTVVERALREHFQQGGSQ